VGVEHYEIRIEGHLSPDWLYGPRQLAIRYDENGETVISGPLDQAALHGLLVRIGSLNLTLVSVIRAKPG
jgi:hypothetical protein